MEKGVRGIALGALVLSIVGLTVAFASLSQTVTVSGTGTVNASSNWDVKVSEASISATGATADSTKLTTTDTSVSLATGGATFTKPGDSITITVKIKNNGTIKAKLDSLTNGDATASSLTCKIGSTDSDYCSTNMTYSVTGPAVNSELAASATAEYTITLTLNESATSLPASDLTVTIPEISFGYVQA